MIALVAICALVVSVIGFGIMLGSSTVTGRQATGCGYWA